MIEISSYCVHRNLCSNPYCSNLFNVQGVRLQLFITAFYVVTFQLHETPPLCKQFVNTVSLADALSVRPFSTGLGRHVTETSLEILRSDIRVIARAPRWSQKCVDIDRCVSRGNTNGGMFRSGVYDLSVTKKHEKKRRVSQSGRYVMYDGPRGAYIFVCYNCRVRYIPWRYTLPSFTGRARNAFVPARNGKQLSR